MHKRVKMKTTTQQFIQALQNASFYDHSTSNIQLIETHISWVLLTGEFVYKIKKPVNLGFLDFSTLEKRHHYCCQELKLNSRLAAEYYLDVVSITGTMQSPKLNGPGEVIEYAVKMKQFPQQAQLDRMLAKQALSAKHMKCLAEKIAEFHGAVSVADSSSLHGDLDHVHKPVMDCYDNIINQITDTNALDRITRLQQWSNTMFQQLTETFILRKKHGFIRECHGDLHLRNIAIVNENVIAFDGIEFSENLRWIDVISEIAFLIMDLDDHNESGYGNIFLNRYLEISGDYMGLKVLPYYLVYRAIVRAMVASIRLNQENITEQEALDAKTEFFSYLDLAEKYIKKMPSGLLISNGFSGSGKTHFSSQLMQFIPMIRLRSDVERKRLSGVAELNRNEKGINAGIYSAEMSEKTYQYLQGLAKELLQLNRIVLIDATFLKEHDRFEFRKLANEFSIPFLILHCTAPLDVMKQRITERATNNADASDADLNVLENQLATSQQFSEVEHQFLIEIDTSNADVISLFLPTIKSHLNLN